MEIGMEKMRITIVNIKITVFFMFTNSFSLSKTVFAETHEKNGVSIGNNAKFVLVWSTLYFRGTDSTESRSKALIKAPPVKIL